MKALIKAFNKEKEISGKSRLSTLDAPKRCFHTVKFVFNSTSWDFSSWWNQACWQSVKNPGSLDPKRVYSHDTQFSNPKIQILTWSNVGAFCWSLLSGYFLVLGEFVIDASFVAELLLWVFPFFFRVLGEFLVLGELEFLVLWEFDGYFAFNNLAIISANASMCLLHQ